MWLGPAGRMVYVRLGRGWTGADRIGSERQGLGLIVFLHSCVTEPVYTVVWRVIMRMIRLCRLNSRRLLHLFAISWFSVFCLSVCVSACLSVYLSLSLVVSVSVSLCFSLSLSFSGFVLVLWAWGSAVINFLVCFVLASQRKQCRPLKAVQLPQKTPIKGSSPLFLLIFLSSVRFSFSFLALY